MSNPTRHENSRVRGANVPRVNTPFIVSSSRRKIT
uniref:Uncharacterized protein n=1 Tax=Podoviridae sp. ct8Lf7 TaxID=2827723 RepID=A0A8S5S0S8_9CAUD|nr:MAG TPA: hypothetical protein [Podoviridae sp. ct8Lf7]